MKIPEILKRLIDGNLKLSILTDQTGMILYFGSPIVKFFPSISVGMTLSDLFPYEKPDERGFYHTIKNQYRIYDSSHRTYKISVDQPADDLVLIQLSPLLNAENRLTSFSLEAKDLPEHLLLMEYMFLQELMELGKAEILLSQEKSSRIEELSRQNAKYLTQLSSILQSNNLLALEYDPIKKGFKFTSESHALEFFKTEHIHKDLTRFAEDLLIPSQQQTFLSYFEDLSPEKPEFEYDLLMRVKENQFEWIGIRVKASKFNDQQPIAVFVVFEKKQTQKELEFIEANAQEEERFRVSREIHDGIGQTLFALRLLLTHAMKRTEAHSMNEYHDEMDHYLNDVIKETRIIINNLGVSVFQNDGLKGAFHKQLDLLTKISSIQTNINWEGPEKLTNPKLDINIFRIFQESVSNVVKHSNATQLQINVRNREDFEMHISDNGKGFLINNNETGFGLNNMKTRAKSINAQLKISSEPGRGTLVVLNTK